MGQPPANNAADCSKLPADILITVLCKLEFPDVFSSAAVCTSWRANARALGNTCACPQTPCLFYATAGGALAAGRSYRLPDLPGPPVMDRYIVGSSHGWLVTADTRSELQLLNTATSEQIGLPPVATMEHVTPVLDDTGELRRYDLSFHTAVPALLCEQTRPPKPYEVSELREALYLKAVLSCDPSRGGSCIVVLIHNPNRQLSFARVGGQQWHWITSSPRCSWYSDCIYHGDAFYALRQGGEIHRYTIQGSRASYEVVFAQYISYNAYVARTSSSGDMLQIRRSTNIPYEREDLQREGVRFGIYKQDLDEQRIVRVESLWVDALFIGQGDTCCLSTRDYPKLLAGHVYFTGDAQHWLNWLNEYKNIRPEVGIHNLKDKTSVDVVSSKPWLNRPSPIWITPSFTKTGR